MNTSVTPVLVARGLRFAEGVNFGRDGTLYCVDVHGGGVWRMPPGGALQEWVHTGGPNGSRFGPDGDLFIADCERGLVLRLAADTGRESVYASACQGQPFHGPNDLCFGPDGTLYFTDPRDSSLSERIGAVYAVSANGHVTRIVEGLAFPNGIAVSPDGATLVVAETHTGILHRYHLNSAAPMLYAEITPLATLSPAGDGAQEAGPDGMAYGADGNLYVAHFAAGLVHAIDPTGRIVASLPSGGPSPTNVGFWQDSLYVTEGRGGAIYRLDIGVVEQAPFMRPW